MLDVGHAQHVRVEPPPLPHMRFNSLSQQTLHPPRKAKYKWEVSRIAGD